MARCGGFNHNGTACSSRAFGDTSFCKRHRAQAALDPEHLAQRRRAHAVMDAVASELVRRMPGQHTDLFMQQLTAAVMNRADTLAQIGRESSLTGGERTEAIRQFANWLEPEALRFHEGIRGPDTRGNAVAPRANTGESFLTGGVALTIPETLGALVGTKWIAVEEACSRAARSHHWRPGGDENSLRYRARDGRTDIYRAPSTETGDLIDDLAEMASKTPQEWGVDTVFLANTIMATVANGVLAFLEGNTAAPPWFVNVDALLKTLGKNHYGQDDRNEQRRWVRRQVLNISRFYVKTRSEVDGGRGSAKRKRTYNAHFFHVIDEGTRWEGERPNDPTRGVPSDLLITPGMFFKDRSGDYRELRMVGNLRALAAIRTGQPTGRWAASMGLAFFRLCVTSEGAVNEVTVTRKDLLSRFPPNPSPTELLKSPNPKRMLQFWTTARTELQDIGWWADTITEPKLPRQRYGAWEEWLEQPVTITPGPAFSTETTHALPVKTRR